MRIANSKKILTKERAEEMFVLQGSTLINRIARGGLKVGVEAGSINGWGYRQMRVDGRDYRAHHIIWLMVKGYLPSELDHINGDRTDNRIENLREVDRQENLRNQKLRKSNSSGVMGVGWDKTHGKWTARIRHDGKNRTLGSFKTYEEAVEARKAAEVIHGYHVNHGRAA